VNKETCIDILRRLRDSVRRNPPEKWRTKSWFLLHKNAPAHRSVLVKDFLVKYNVVTLEQPHTSLVWFQLIFTCASTEINIEGMTLL
jgi:hypothetical protein